MSAEILVNQERQDIRELPLETNIAIYTGTFDPLHSGHLKVVQTVLNYSNIREDRLENCGVDLLLFYPHNHAKRKKPAPLSVRIEILKELIRDNNRLGILLTDGFESEQQDACCGVSWARVLFDALKQCRPLEYSRVISCERVKKALLDELNILYFVVPRNHVEIEEGLSSELPPNFFILPSYVNPYSSTDLRDGGVVFGDEYEGLHNLVGEYYPNARLL